MNKSLELHIFVKEYARNRTQKHLFIEKRNKQEFGVFEIYLLHISFVIQNERDVNSITAIQSVCYQ
jgi:hypothetical protein